VDFFFYADKIDNALGLANRMREMNYNTKGVRSGVENEKYLITGNAPRMHIKPKEMHNWSNQMYGFADELDCEFDG
jgi:hypothetical protein